MIARQIINEKQAVRRKQGRPVTEPIDLDQYSPVRRQQAVLLAGHMLLDEVPLATIRFVIKAYPLFLEKGQVSATDMAVATGMTPQAAGKHVRKLVAAQYLCREHYRAWSINTEYLETLGRSYIK